MCNTCGSKGDHQDQISIYPDGITVVLLQRIPEKENFLPIGSVGKVIGHCDDGRAIINFKNSELCDHTFHHPATFLAHAFPEDYMTIKDHKEI